MSKLKHIMHITYSIDMGGLEKLVLNLSKTLNKSRYKVSICTLRKGMRLVEEFQQAGIGVYTIPKYFERDLSLVVRLAKFLKEYKVDCIHTHNSGAWIYGGLAAKLAGIPVIHTEHSNLFNNKKLLMIAERILSKFTFQVVCDSGKVQRFLVEEEGIRPEKVVTILNGIDVDRYGLPADRPALRQALGIGPKTTVVGTVARLVGVKDQKTMIRAFRQFQDFHTDSLLVLIGDGPLRRELEEEAASLGIGPKVTFLGERNDIPDLLPIFDIFMLTSLSEGLPLSLLEAMATGLAVVATKVGAIPELIVPGENGFLAQVGNAEALGHAVRELALDGELRRKMGEANRQKVTALCSLDRMTASYEDIYDRALKLPAQTRPKRKILVFTNVFPRESTPNTGFYVLEQVRRLGASFDVKIVVASPRPLFGGHPAGLPLHTRHQGFDIYQPVYPTVAKIGVFLSGGAYYQAVKPLVEHIHKTFPFELILAYWTYPEGYAAAKFGKDYGVPVLLRPRGSDINFYLENKLLSGLIQQTLTRIDRIIPVTEHLKNRIAKLNIREEKLHFLHNGIDTGEFFPQERGACRAKLGLTPTARVVLFVGNLVPVKGIDHFAAAIRLLDTPENAGLIFVVCGKGPLEAIMGNLTRELKHVRVLLKGDIKHSQLPLWLNASNVLCLPSVNEGCPNVVMESLACGVPVVASNVGGVPELVNSPELGILVPTKNAEALAKGITEALNRTWDTQKLTSRFKDQSWDRVVEHLTEECNTLLKK